MCKRCGNDRCKGTCPSKTSSNQEVANLQAQLAEMSDQMTVLLANTQWLLTGHPILAIENADDIALFDFATGLGADAWLGWAVCDGQTQKNAATGKPLITPNFTNRFLVQAGGEYSVGATGGSDTVTLDVTEIPAHNHGVTDPGHTHTITDPGHNHAITDPEHNHTQNSHTHGYQDPGAGSSTGNYLSATPSAYEISNSADEPTDATTATNNAAATGISINSHVTGISIDSADTGITTNNTGGGLAHENRPPYFAIIYIIKL